MRSIEISELRYKKSYQDDKIEIIFSTGEVSNQLSVYLFDTHKKSHHVLWKISPDRCSQSFDKVNDKIRNFVIEKVEQWKEEEENERKRKLIEAQLEDQKRKDFIKNLIDQF
jgi:hypothetical protein